jgi:hypothetical protein
MPRSSARGLLATRCRRSLAMPPRHGFSSRAAFLADVHERPATAAGLPLARVVLEAYGALATL